MKLGNVSWDEIKKSNQGPSSAKTINNIGNNLYMGILHK